MAKAVSKELIDKITLKVVQTGVDKINFKILKMVRDGANINKVMKEIGLTKVPVNIRINELERVGLVNRWRGTGIVILTDLGKDFMNIINNYQDVVRSKLIYMLKNISDS